jgi:hypothetical protein
MVYAYEALAVLAQKAPSVKMSVRFDALRRSIRFLKSRTHTAKNLDECFGAVSSKKMWSEKRSEMRLPGHEMGWKGMNCSLTAEVDSRVSGLSEGRWRALCQGGIFVMAVGSHLRAHDRERV